MTRLCFGGSFNPIHVGHLIVSRAVAEAMNLNGVLLIPNAQPPHKSTADLASAVHRLKMCQLVGQSDPFFAVSDIDNLLLKPTASKRSCWASIMLAQSTAPPLPLTALFIAFSAYRHHP